MMKQVALILILSMLLSCKNDKKLEILDDPEPVAELKSKEEHMQAAQAFLKRGETQKALDELTQSIRTYHNEQAYMLKSDILLSEKRYYEFLENTEDALRFEQFQSPTLMMHNGLGYELIGEEEKAEPFYKKALFNWTLEGANQQNYRTVLTQRPFLIAVLMGKETAVKDFDKVFSDYAQTSQDTVIKQMFRPLLLNYDGSGMTYFYKEIEENPTE